MPNVPHSRILATLTAVLLCAGATVLYVSRSGRPGAGALEKQATQLARQVAAIEAAETEVLMTLWADEMAAQKCGRVIEGLWDRLNAATNKMAFLAAFPVGEVTRPVMSPPSTLPHQIRVSTQVASGKPWTPSAWIQIIAELERSGWQWAQAEFRHVQFDRNSQGGEDKSRFYFAAHLVNGAQRERAIVEGYLIVTWRTDSQSAEGVSIRGLETDRLSIRTRHGEPPFHQVLLEEISPPAGSYFIDPLLLHDLDGDGFSEIILAAKNLVFTRGSDGQYKSRALCASSPGLIFTAILGDFDGDGATDLLCANFDGLSLFPGSPQGSFDQPGRLTWPARPRLKYAQALTCGDVDGDGDLDVWLGQYKVPYDRGQMPTPFYDANDGFPSYLLLNDGHGHFSDATVSAGLGQKRWRRVYSASLIDVNGDHYLDLVVASDFAGLDLYANNGHGYFTDKTSEWIPERHAFGMAQISTDFNVDGILDLLMIGMNVPVADRLQHFGRARAGFEKYLSMSGPLACGNRLYLGQGAGRFRQNPLNDSMAHTGWSWGCSAFDFDNDSWPDLYIANGHETKQSVRDYETEFWLHDIYVGTSKDSLAAFAYFQTKFARTRGQGMSYGGYEKNRLFLNQRGDSFVEIGHLMGVALEQDSRNVVTDDLNNDGRMDLVVTTFEAWPQVKQTLRIFQNKLPAAGNWIGFRLPEHGGGGSPIGAQITLQFRGKQAIQTLVAGNSYRSQQPYRFHFGLGDMQEVDAAEIRWPNGQSLTLNRPGVNRSHLIRRPTLDESAR